MTISRAALLVGSAKPAGASTSEALGTYLLERLAERGVATQALPVDRSPAARERRQLVEAVARADLFVLAAPVYVDSLPYLAVRALESIAAARTIVRPPCAFAALVNCGFPEARQCDTAIAIARAFARRSGFTWSGALALGEGGAIDGKRLQDRESFTRHVRAALNAAAAALAEGQEIPPSAVDEMARPLMPARLYTLVNNSGWRIQAARHHARSRLAARPYA